MTLQYIRELLSSDQDILAAGNAAVEVVAGVLQTDGSLPDVGDVVQLGTRKSLVYDGLRNPTLDIRFVKNKTI